MHASFGGGRSWRPPCQLFTPVLLVDDMNDSRWTVTLLARELRRAGVAAVYPLALALAS